MNNRKQLIEKYYILKTQKGRYKIKGSIQVINGEITYSLNVGGKHAKCVQLTVPFKNPIGKLTWIQAGEDCSLDGIPQRGDLMSHMVHIAITIAKEINPALTTIELLDNATFQCKLPNGKPAPMSHTDYDLAFYQKSYYEKRYGAILINPTFEEQYQKSKNGFTDPFMKPDFYNFGTIGHNVELIELYKETTTWKEFFDKISEKYKEQKCLVLVPWLKDALMKIMNRVSYSGQEWKINVETHIPVEYTFEEVQYGGMQRTRKNNKARIDTEATIIEILDIDWQRYFQK